MFDCVRVYFVKRQNSQYFLCHFVIFINNSLVMISRLFGFSLPSFPFSPFRARKLLMSCSCDHNRLPANIYLFKFNGNTRKRCKICSKWTIKTPEQRQWRRSGGLIFNFEHISHLSLVFYYWLWSSKCCLGCFKWTIWLVFLSHKYVFNLTFYYFSFVN